MLCPLSLPIHFLSSLHAVTRQEHHRSVLPTLPKFSLQPLLNDEVPRVSLCAQCSTLCYPMDCSPPGSFVRGISQAGMLEWTAISSFRVSSRSRDRTHASCSSSISGGFFIPAPPGNLLPSLVLVFLFLKVLLEYSCFTVLTLVSYITVLAIGRSFGGGKGNPLQYSCQEIPWTEEPGRLQSMGSERVGHD